MFTIKLTPERDMIAAHRKARATAARVRANARAQSAITGALEAARLLDRREIVFRGRAYSVAPVPWPLAAELLEVREGIAGLAASNTKGTPQDLRTLFDRAARLSKQVVRPAGRWRRLLWPITRNPFRKATPWEVGRNLGFFSLILSLDAEPWETATPGALASGISQAISRGSSERSPHGSAATATRSAGGIS